MNDVAIFDATVEVETRDGRRAEGFGSMTMGNVWAWPAQKVDIDASLQAMVEFGHAVTRRASEYQGMGHPLEITHDLGGDYATLAEEVTRRDGLDEDMPRLAQLVSASPLEAAIEGNARQYVPVANKGWEDRFPGMFKISDGMLDTSVLHGPGLGF